jgi:hypothetical protein
MQLTGDNARYLSAAALELRLSEHVDWVQVTAGSLSQQCGSRYFKTGGPKSHDGSLYQAQIVWRAFWRAQPLVSNFLQQNQAYVAETKSENFFLSVI